MADQVLLDVEGSVLVVTLNRPDARNAIDGALADGLLAAMARLDEDPALRVGVLTGAGRGFSAGMDLKVFAGSGVPRGLQRFFRTGSSKPLVAAIEGFALAGGLELALTCDIIVSARGARLGIPEAGVGLFAAGGGLLRLPRLLPYGVAMELALTGDPIDAEQAHALGLVTRLTETGGSLTAARELAERIARNAPLAVAASKRIIQESHGRTEAEFWELQRPVTEAVFASADAREGALSFAEKRPPTWTGT